MADKRTINASDRWVPLTPSDTVNLVEPPRSIYVSVAGTLSMADVTGTTRDFGTVSIGILQVQPSRVNSTGTTATVIGLY